MVAAWLESQTNIPMQRKADIVTARTMTDLAGLPRHADPPKDWDNLIAVYWAQKLCDPVTASVMDAGVGDGSAFLQGLERLGFHWLYGINIDIRDVRNEGRISYGPGDITAMPTESGSLDFIACLSVIEHGVDLPKFLAEAARVLKPGGHLFISTDYWRVPVDTGGQMAFGAPVKVFELGDIGHLLADAADVRLMPTSTPSLACDEPTVLWLGMEYTFLNLLLRRV